MDTFFARNRFSAYLDGTLPDGEAAEVEAALAEDPALREEFDRMRGAIELLRSAGPLSAPAGFHARVMAAVEHEPAPGGVISLFRRGLNRVSVEALAVAAAGVIVVLAIQGRVGEDPTDDGVGAQLELPSLSTPLDRHSRRSDEAQPAAEPDALAGASADPTTRQAEGPPPSPTEPAPPSKIISTSTASTDGDLRTVSSRRAASTAAASAAASADSPAPHKTRPTHKTVAPPRGAGEGGSEPYYTEWERQGGGAALPDTPFDGGSPAELSQGIDMGGPLAYRLAGADSEVLYELERAARSAGGRMTDAAGSTLAPQELSASDTWLQVQLVVPRDQADGVSRRLRDMGGVATPPPGDSVMYSPDFAVFVVEITYQP